MSTDGLRGSETVETSRSTFGMEAAKVDAALVAALFDTEDLSADETIERMVVVKVVLHAAAAALRADGMEDAVTKVVTRAVDVGIDRTVGRRVLRDAHKPKVDAAILGALLNTDVLDGEEVDRRMSVIGAVLHKAVVVLEQEDVRVPISKVIARTASIRRDQIVRSLDMNTTLP